MDVQAFIPFHPSPPGKSSIPPMSDPKEKFFRHFQAEITTIQDQIEALAATSPVGGERKDCTDAILAGISRLNNEVVDASEYVPAYDQRTYSQAIKALTEKLNETTSKFAPKSRFQFKPRAAASSAPAVVDTRSQPSYNELASAVTTAATAASTSTAVQDDTEDGDSVGSLPMFKNYNEELARPHPGGSNASGGSTVRKPSFSAAKNISIHGHSGLHIMLPATASRATSSGSLTDLERCIVDMTIPTSTGAPFAGLHLKNIRQSLIVAGHVAGAVHITGLQDCVVVVAARQVRVHECTNVDVYLHCASHPIIEDCRNMQFAPIPDFYMAKAEDVTSNQWDQVDDFKWLKSEPSPNWSILPEEKRIAESVWKNTVCGNPSLSTDDILRLVGAFKSS